MNPRPENSEDPMRFLTNPKQHCETSGKRPGCPAGVAARNLIPSFRLQGPTGCWPFVVGSVGSPTNRQPFMSYPETEANKGGVDITSSRFLN